MSAARIKDSGLHDSGFKQVDEQIHLDLVKSATSSATTSTSSPPSQRRSPENNFSSGEEILNVAANHRPPWFSVYQNTDSDKFQLLKQKKKLKESRKEKKNVVNSFSTTNGNDESYSVENVLESLGELSQEEKKPSKNANKKGASNGKNRRRSNEKQNKSTSDDENGETTSESGTFVDDNSQDYSSTVEFNHIHENFSADKDEPMSELKRQVSRSTDDLSSFTKVTKKQKRKKKVPGGDQQIVEQQSQPVGVPRTPPAVNAIPKRSDSDRAVVHQLPAAKFPLAQSQSVDDGAVKWSTPNKKDLDLAVDFPPLSDDLPALETVPAVGQNVWPVVKASNNSSASSDSSAVIENNASDPATHQAPPDLTVQANALPTSFMAGTALPDVAAQASPANYENPKLLEPARQPNGQECSDFVEQEGPVQTCDDGKIIPSSDGASFMVDNVEIVVSEKLYSHRSDIQRAPVTIFTKANNPLEEWTSKGDVTFGFDVNEELLSMSFVDTAETSLALTESNSQPLTLNQEDNAIVSFGESLDDLKATISPESGISLSGHPTMGSGRSTPQYDSFVSSWADQIENEDHECDQLPAEQPLASTKFNYKQILEYVQFNWSSAQQEFEEQEAARSNALSN